MKSSPKEGLAIIIGKLKNQDKQNPYGQHSKLGSLLAKPDDSKAEDDMSNEDAQMEAAKDMLNAIEAKDPSAMLEAMKDLLVLCEQDECDDDGGDQDVEQSHDHDHSSMFDEES